MLATFAVREALIKIATSICARVCVCVCVCARARTLAAALEILKGF
jgi:hypothetical protein